MEGISNTAGLWMGWIGIILAVIGFFLTSSAWVLWLGIAAIVLGIIGLFSPQKVLNTISIVLGVVGVILYFV